MEHTLSFILEILLQLGKVQCLGGHCDGAIYANSVIKVQVTVFFCLALNWVLKPDDGKGDCSIKQPKVDIQDLHQKQVNQDLYNARVKEIKSISRLYSLP